MKMIDTKFEEQQMRFEAWMAKVERAILSAIGLSYKDLADQPYFAWFEAGYSPSRAAKQSIASEGG